MRKAFAGAALLAALTLALAACGGNDNGGAGTAATEAPTTTAAQAANGATVAVANGRQPRVVVEYPEPARVSSAARGALTIRPVGPPHTRITGGPRSKVEREGGAVAGGHAVLRQCSPAGR